MITCHPPRLPGSGFFSSRLFSLCRVLGGSHVLLLFRRWQQSRHAKRLDPKLASTSLRVIEMLVFLFLHLLVRRQNQRRLGVCRVLSKLTQQLPIQMVLGFSKYHTFSSNNLC